MHKQKLTTILAALAMPVLLTGCMTMGHFNKANTTQVDLGKANFRVVRTGVKGTHKTVRFLGLGNSPSHSIAMAELRKEAGLEGTSRALVNITEEKNSLLLLPIYVQTELVLTADVVEFVPDGQTPSTALSRATPKAKDESDDFFSLPSAEPEPARPSTPDEMLHAYATAHNKARSGSFDELVSLFHPGAKVIFHGEHKGVLSGATEIRDAFRKHPPKDDMILRAVRPTAKGAVAKYSYSNEPSKQIGKIAVRISDGRITRLDMQIGKNGVN